MVNINSIRDVDPLPPFEPLSSNPLTESLLPPYLVCGGFMQPHHHSQYLSKIISLQQPPEIRLVDQVKVFLKYYKCRASGPSLSSNTLSDTPTLLLPSSTFSCTLTITNHLYRIWRWSPLQKKPPDFRLVSLSSQPTFLISPLPLWQKCYFPLLTDKFSYNYQPAPLLPS